MLPNDFEEAKLVIEKCERRRELKLVIEFEHFLKNYFERMGFHGVEGQYEEEPGNITVRTKKRQDATYGKVVIEYEHVGKLSTIPGKRHAIKQISEDYLSAYSKEERRDMVGIVFDGKTVIFIRWVENDWLEDDREVNQQSLDMMINYLIGLYKISFKELPQEFGFHREETRKVLKLLYEKSFGDNQKAQMLFDEWNLRFSSIYGNAFSKEKIKKDFEYFAKEIGIEKIEENRLVFIIHTFYAFIVKIIAAEVANSLFQYATQSHIKSILGAEDIQMELRKIEEGKFFRGVGVENFIEGTFLSWYLEVWDEEIKDTIKQIIQKLDWYDFGEFVTKPEYVVDYLKNFYQKVFPKNLRHDLGEFYTPDWLAKYIVNQSGFDGDVKKRVLDPACGSGTFLIAILNKIYERYKSVQTKEKLIEDITKNIAGFDINPVAVLTARTNYLISLSRFNFQQTTINIPIYLTDSIILPEITTQTEITDRTQVYEIKTTKDVFEIPVDIKKQIIAVIHFLKENLEKKQEKTEIPELLKQHFDFKNEVIDRLCKLYDKICKLHKNKQNKIWFDIILNQFATLFQDKFDFVIGNPPWVNWEFLGEEYRKHLIKINDSYGLYFTKGLDSRLGKIRRDLSAIFFYVCSDVYLKDGGIIAFLIKPMYQIPSGKGFRNFNRINKDGKISKLNIPMKVISVEEITKENPFEINNEVSVIFAKKGESTKYPVVYKKWTGKRTHELVDYIAEPSDENDLSTWMIYQGEKPLNVLGGFDYNIRQGINLGLKEAFFDLELLIDKGELIQIRNTQGKVKDIEKDKIYPMIMSRHINKWKIGDANNQKYTYCILPQDYPGEDNEQELKNTCPKTWEWLNDFRNQLLERKSKMFSKKPFYSIYGLGNWDSKYKVVWNSMGFYPNFVVVSSVNDVFLGKKLVLPEHVNMFIPTNNRDEAHYICAVLNSFLVKEGLRILSSKSKSGLSASIINKIRLDLFNPDNEKQKKLAELSKKAHQFAERNEKDNLGRIENNIDFLVHEIYKQKRKKLDR